MRFEFVQDRRVCAAGCMKGAAVGRDGLLTNAESFAAMGVPVLDAPLPAAVRDGIAAERGVMATAW
jgi:hypothetical protein